MKKIPLPGQREGKKAMVHNYFYNSFRKILYYDLTFFRFDRDKNPKET